MIIENLEVKTKYLVFLLVFLVLGIMSLVLGSSVFSQEDPNEIAKRYGVTFPIEELGACKDYASCHTYCEDPINSTSCIDFAKKKGFYKDEKFDEQSPILAKARTVLGCNSYESCRSFCELKENFEKCHSFAQDSGLVGGYIEDPTKSEILNKAKEVLGCNSYDSCKNYCEQESNREKCSEFARTVGLRGGHEVRGPGGCTSQETCRAFCSDPNNYQICSSYSSPGGGSFSGPGRCNSEASCRAYCEQHPGECGHYSSGGAPGGMTPGEYCRQYPDKCGGTSGYDPASTCSKTPGCSWTGTTCQCPGGGTYSPYPGTYDPATECAKKIGCSWTGTTCQCPYPPPSSYDPATECAKQSGCSWTGTTCQCSGSSFTTPPPPSAPTPTPTVQGSTFTGGALQVFLHYLLSLFGK